MIKKEARILGLSAARKGRSILVVGVVFRGSLWLDGVISCTLEMKETKQNSTLSGVIKGSKQYSQLHAIILKKPFVSGWKVNLAELARRVKLPVIATTNRRTSRASGIQGYDITVNKRHVSVLAVGLRREDAEQLLNVACTPTSIIPEAVRVAELLVQEAAMVGFLAQRREIKITENLTGAQDA